MKRALILTAYDRPHYWEETLESWSAVRGFRSWPLRVSLEPSSSTVRHVELLEKLEHPDLRITFNQKLQGVLHHPWRAFERAFDEGFDFVVRAEDDLIVSDDILEYFEWASEEFKDWIGVGSVCAFTHEDGPADQVRVSEDFSPWVWGTWASYWKHVIGPTWDHDYSTFNAVPGNESGWDWNLKTRIFPKRALRTAFPRASRVQNIGQLGTHARPEQFETTASYVQYRDKEDFFLTRR